MSNPKTLIVGGAGYIGGHLTDILKKDFDVTVLDNLTYEDKYLKGVKFINFNINDFNLDSSLKDIITKFDTIIWLAAVVGDGACEVDKKVTKICNEDSVKWLVDNFPDKQIVFTSTCSVYGINNDLIDETAVPNPISTYAVTKLNAEQYIINNHKNYLIFRLGTLYGIGDEFSRIRLDLVLNFLTCLAVRGKNLTVFGGEQWRPLLHVKDVGEGIKFCLENNITGLYNLSSGNVIVKDIAETIKQIIPSTVIDYLQIKPSDARNYKVKNDKILATGWRPKYTMENGIAEIQDVISARRIKNPDADIYHNANFLKNKYNFNHA